MKIKEHIEAYHEGLKTQVDKKTAEGEQNLSSLKKKLARDEQSLTDQLSFQETQIKIAFDSGRIDQESFDAHAQALDNTMQRFQETKETLIKNQEEINERSFNRMRDAVTIQLRKQTRDRLLNECVRLNSKAGFRGMPMHVQRFIKKWELIAVEIGDDPQRFLNTLQKEKSGVMMGPWKQYNEKLQLRAENRQLKAEIARLKNGNE